jgi:hypothetical protein
VVKKANACFDLGSPIAVQLHGELNIGFVRFATHFKGSRHAAPFRFRSLSNGRLGHCIHAVRGSHHLPKQSQKGVNLFIRSHTDAQAVSPPRVVHIADEDLL